MIDPAILDAQRKTLEARAVRAGRLTTALATASRAAEFGLEPLGRLRFAALVLDLVGQRYGRLLVLGIAGRRRHPNGRTKIHWLCRCGCGREVDVDGSHLREGLAMQCGRCQRAQAAQGWSKRSAARNVRAA